VRSAPFQVLMRLKRREAQRTGARVAMFKSTVYSDVPGHPPGASFVRLPLLPVPSLHLRAAGTYRVAYSPKFRPRN
jgi:hypothetical protein